MSAITEYWNKSYGRNENFIFYPHDECVKFLNRFIKKKISYTSEFIEIYKTSNTSIKVLDFGCGIGRMTGLMSECEIESFGIDISEKAIEKATSQERDLQFKPTFSIYDGTTIPYNDLFFDFTISYAVLDSMPFTTAQRLVKEIDRVTKKYFYCSLISLESFQVFKEYEKISDDEIIVKEKHEFGTIQSFYDIDKINKLIENTSFSLVWGEKIMNTSILDPTMIHGRYHIVLEKTL